jgi:hypothetical protein
MNDEDKYGIAEPATRRHLRRCCVREFRIQLFSKNKGEKEKKKERKKLIKKYVKKGPARVSSLGRTTPDRAAAACPASVHGSTSSRVHYLSLRRADDWVGYRLRRRRLRQVSRPSSASSPVASTHQVFPSLVFPSCCAKPSTQTLFGYLMPTNFEPFAKKNYRVYMCTSIVVSPCFSVYEL